MKHLLFGLILTGCAVGTEPNPVPMRLELMTLRTPEEIQAWPGSAVIEGGTAITIRGTAELGCGTIAGAAERRGVNLTVRVEAVNTDRPCVAVLAAWRPFRAELSSLPAGTYHVTVNVVGYSASAAGTVSVVN